MRWIDDPSGRFPARPFFEPVELDTIGAGLAVEAAGRRGRRRFLPPLDTDALLVLIEGRVDDLDLFADLEPRFGPGVEAVTEFRAGRLPVVSIERRLSSAPRRRLRLRFTLAHELGHVVLHRELWERRFAQPSLLPQSPPGSWAAHSRPSSVPDGERAGAPGGRADHREGPGPGTVDWLEWQAASLAASVLVPAPVLAERIRGRAPWPWTGRGGWRPVAGTPEGDELVSRVARDFSVSTEAAAVRLHRLGWLREPTCGAQRSLWPE